MRIAIVSTSVLPAKPYRLFQGYGGLEKITGSLAEGFAKAGHDVLLVGAPGTTAEGCKTLEVPFGASDEDVAKQLAQELPSYDVVQDHQWTHWASLLYAQEPHRFRGSHIQVLHHGVLSDIHTPPPLQHPNWTCFSNAQAQHISSTLHVETRTAYHGVDTDVFRPGTRSGGYLLLMSRFSPEKGVLEAVRALKRAKQRIVIMADDRLIANAEYGKLVMAECDGMMTRFVPGTSISLDQQIAWIQNARALIHTPLAPWIEIFGLVVAEALACGVPVIGTMNGALPEIIEHGKTGFLSSTVEGIVPLLDHLDEIDPKACRAAAESRYSLSSMTSSHLALLEDIISGREW